MSELQSYWERYKSLSVAKRLSGDEAERAVKRNGYALQYVSQQTEAVCLEAVKQNGDALQYVDVSMFGVEVAANGRKVMISRQSAVSLGLA